MAKIAITPSIHKARHAAHRDRSQKPFWPLPPLAAKISPVRIEKNGRLEALIVSAEQFADLERRANAASPKLTSAQFAETYKEWIGAQQQHMDEQGLWCDDIRTW